MDLRVHDGPSCRFVMKIREVVPVPIFQEFKCFETKTLMQDTILEFLFQLGFISLFAYGSHNPSYGV